MEKDKKNSIALSEWLGNIIFAIVILAIGYIVWHYLKEKFIGIVCVLPLGIYFSGLLTKKCAWWKKIHDSVRRLIERVRIYFVFPKIVVISGVTILIPTVLLSIVLKRVFISELKIANESFVIFISIVIISLLSFLPGYGRFIMNKCRIKDFLEAIFMDSCEYNAVHIKFYMYVYYFVLMLLCYSRSYLQPDVWQPDELIKAFLIYFAADRIIYHNHLIKDQLTGIKEKHEKLKRDRIK